MKIEVETSYNYGLGLTDHGARINRESKNNLNLAIEIFGKPVSIREDKYRGPKEWMIYTFEANKEALAKAIDRGLKFIK